MDFSTFVTKETADLAERLSAAASAAIQAEVQRVSDEANARLMAVEANLAARSHEADELAAALKNLQVQGETLRNDLRSHKERADAAEGELTVATKRHEQARQELQAANDALRADAAAAEQALRAKADADREELLRTAAANEERIRSQATAAQEQMRRDAADAEQRLRAEADAVQEKLRQDLQGKLDAALAAQTRAADTVKTTEAQLRAARAQADAARAELEAARLEMASAASDGLLERLLVSFETLAGASTISDLLVALAEALASEFKRVALFRVKGNKLQGEYQTGFEFTTDVAKVVIPLGMDSLLARAVSSGCIETLEADGGEAVRAPFGGSPTCALALPVTAAEETLGILYADDGADGSIDTAAGRAVKGRFAELLLRHAVALVLRLTAELRTIAELRNHAARLLNHAEEMYAADVESGVQGSELQARLLENLECARRLYAQRVAVEGPSTAGLLEDQLVVLLEQRSGSAFGRDLAAVSASGAERAEAS